MSSPGPVRATRAQATETSRMARPVAAPLRRLQMTLGNQAVARIFAGQAIQRSPGLPLEAAARTGLEARFGADLGSVRVHDDPAACEAVGSTAYTIGEHIVLSAKGGRALLAHEIAHVLQQRHDASGSAPARLEGEARRAAESGDAPVTVRERGRVGLARQEAPDQPAATITVTESEGGRRVVSVDGVPVFGYVVSEDPTAVAWNVNATKGGSLTIDVTRDTATYFRLNDAGINFLSTHGYAAVNVTVNETPTPFNELGERPGPRLIMPVEPRTLPQATPPRPRRPGAAAKPQASKPSPKLKPSHEKPPPAGPDVSIQTTDQAPAALPPLPPPVTSPEAPTASPEPPTASSPPAADSPAAAAAVPQPAAPVREAPAPTLPVRSGEDLVDEFSGWITLDADGLGARLAEYARQGMFGVVNDTLDEVVSFHRDNLSLAMVSVMSDPELDAMLKTPEGKAMNLRLYDELTSGWVAGDEQAQAERLLQARYRTADPMATVNPAMKVIPFEGIGFTKFDSASLSVQRLDDGRISVRSFMADSSDRSYARNLAPGFMAGLPEVFDPDEIIGIYLVDDDRQIQVPAMFLLQLSNQEDTKTALMIGEVVVTGLTLGAAAPEVAAADVGVDAAADVGVEAATRSVTARLLAGAARAVTVADRAATVIGGVGVLIDDHRGLIIRTFGEKGREGLEIWSKIEAVTAVYGVGRGLTALVQLAAGMRSTLATWRALRAAAKDQAPEDLQALDETIAEADKALRQIEDAAKDQQIDLPGPGATDDADLLPRQTPVPAEQPVLQVGEVNIPGEVANDTEEALALASGDRPRASLGGGSREGGGTAGGSREGGSTGGGRPGTPSGGPKATAASTPSRPPARIPAQWKSSFTTEEIEEHVQSGGGHEIPVERQVHDPSNIMSEDELSEEKGVQPAHLAIGRVLEDEQLLKRGLTQADKVPWDPGPAQLKDPEFWKIVGLPEYTPGGELVGCILDGPGLEIKSGSSLLESTYQLRLMVYRSRLLGETLEISTTRPVEAGFRAWLTSYGVKITPFIK